MKDYSKELTSEQKTVKVFTTPLNKRIEKIELANKELSEQLRIGGVSNFVRQELERRVDLILSEPDGIVRETMIKNIPLDL